MEPSARVGLGRPVQRMLQGPNPVVPDSGKGGTSRHGTHPIPPAAPHEQSSGPSQHRRLCCPTARPVLRPPPTPSRPPPTPGSTPVIGRRRPRLSAARFGRGGLPSSRRHPLKRSAPSYAEESFAAAFQDLHRFHGLHREPPGSALPQCLPTRQASLALRTAQLLPPTGLSTLGFDPTRYQAKPPACYRASWQLPGPDSHRQATTSFRSGHNR